MGGNDKDSTSEASGTESSKDEGNIFDENVCGETRRYIGNVNVLVTSKRILTVQITFPSFDPECDVIVRVGTWGHLGEGQASVPHFNFGHNRTAWPSTSELRSHEQTYRKYMKCKARKQKSRPQSCFGTQAMSSNRLRPICHNNNGEWENYHGVPLPPM